MKSIPPVLILSAALVLAGCLPQVTPIPPPPSATSTSPALAVPTVTVTVTQPEPSDTPVPSASASPAPKSPTLPAPTASGFLPLLVSAKAAPDCARLPGFPTCAASVPLTGRLAVLDPARQVIDLADFTNQQTWQIKAPEGVKGIAWRDQGNILLANYGDQKTGLAWTDPAKPGSKHPDPLSPLGTPIFKAADGSSAWLETTSAFAFIYHVQLAGSGKEQTWPAEAQPSDKIHQLLGWVPGTRLLLGGYHFGANSMWVTGNRLYTLDAQSGKIKELPSSMRLDGVFQWHPSQTGLMLFSEGGMGTRPALLDVNTAKVTYLVNNENLFSTYPSWSKDGAAILFEARTLSLPAGSAPPLTGPDALYMKPAIFIMDWPARTSRALTQPPAGQQDEWPQMLPDGKLFLYVRSAAEGQPVQLRLGSLDGSQDAPIAAGFFTPSQPGPFIQHWETLVAYTP